MKSAANMKKGIFLMLLCLHVIVLMTAVSVEAKKYKVTAKGRVLCKKGLPVPYVTVRLRDKDPGRDDTFGKTTTDSKGRFKVSGKAGDVGSKPDPYIEIEYKHNGRYGGMEVQKESGRNRKDKTGTKKFSKTIDFGDIYLKNEHCRAYAYTLKAMRDYKSSKRADAKIPYGKLKVITRAPLHGGTPYATRKKIRIPSGYSYRYSTAKHELAHTVRHYLDGSLTHFLADVKKYNYLQKHSCNKKTNYGFAFNEGWAHYWSGACKEKKWKTDYRYEGNVANALRKLQSDCKAKDKDMIAILKKNVHSYKEFEKEMRKRHKCK